MTRMRRTDTMARTDADDLLLGEWACLGVLYKGPAGV